MITSACGTGTARWIASIMRSTSSAARKPRAKPAPRPAIDSQSGALLDHSHGPALKGKKRPGRYARLAAAIVTAADVQDRDGGLALLATLFGLFPFLGKLFADSEGPSFTAPWRHPARSRDRDRQAIRSRASSSRGVGGSNAPSPGSTAAGLAKDWETSPPQRARLHQARVHSTHAPKTL